MEGLLFAPDVNNCEMLYWTNVSSLQIQVLYLPLEIVK